MQQLSIPYEQVSVAGRDFIREKKIITAGSRTSYWIPFDEITVRDGFNQRKDYGDLTELAQWIKDHDGQLPEPLLLDVLKDGRVQIVRGHRRREAILLLISKGEFDPKKPVEFFVNNTKVTEFEKMADQYLSNNGAKRFTVLEAAEVAYSLKYNFGKELTDEQVGSAMGVSRQTITNYITLASQNDDIKQLIRSNELSINDALDAVRANKKAAKEATKKQDDSGKTSTAPVEPKDELAEDIKGLDELSDQAKEYLENQAAKANAALIEIADEVECTRDELIKKVGYRLAAPACRMWVDEFVSEDTGEVVGIDRKEVILANNVMVDGETIDILVTAGVTSVFIFKEKSVAPSVITEPIAEREKSKYDEGRPEIEKIQGAIRAADKIEAIINKLDVPDQTKQDIAYQVHWLQENIQFCREWIHNNKKR